jgi:hypothetical protein
MTLFPTERVRSSRTTVFPLALSSLVLSIGLLAGASAAPPSAPAGTASASLSPHAGAGLLSLKPGEQVELHFDAAALARLRRGSRFDLPLGRLGTLPLVFDQVTPLVNGVAYWDAHRPEDPAQRVSLKVQNGQFSGALYLRDRKLIIDNVKGRSLLRSLGGAEAARQLAEAPRLFKPTPVARAESPVAIGYPGEAAPSVSWPVSFNTESLKRLPLNSEVGLDLPDGRQLAVVHDRVVLGRSGSYTFIGYVREQGIDHRVVITTGSDGAAFGVVNLADGELRLESHQGRQWLVDVRRSGLRYAPMAEPLSPPGPADLPVAKALLAQRAGAAPSTGPSASTGVSTAALPVADATEVDLMIAYSPGLVSRLGSTSAALTRIDNLVAITNQALIDSEVAIRLRLVHSLPVAQEDNVSQSQLLGDLSAGRGAFAPVLAARDQYGADLVQFIHKPTAGVGSCGIGYLSVGAGPRGSASAGYSVIDDSCPTMVMAHELGHNFGNNHDHAQGGGTPVYPYAWGYIVPGTDLGDIMAYASQRYYRFSNPRISGCAGQACGQTDYADTSLSMNNIRQIVAGYRPTRVPSGADPATSTCLFEGANFQGASFCSVTGAFDMPATLAQQVSSVRVAPGGSVTLYRDTNLGGGALTLVSSEPDLAARQFDNAARSFVARANLNGRYWLQALHSGKCIDLYGGNGAEGAALVQWPCDGGPNQVIDVAQSGMDSNGPQYTFTLALTGKVIDVSSASTANGATIWQYTANGTVAQRFRINRSGSNDFNILNINSRRVFDIAGGSQTNGAKLQQWEFFGNGNQRFRLVPVATP